MAEEKRKLTGLQMQFVAARDKSVPLIAVRTADPASTVQMLGQVVITPEDRVAPVVVWDAVSGIVGGPGNQPGTTWAKSVKGDGLGNPTEALILAQKLPEHGTMFVLNGNDYYSDPAFRQALWNLRDPFKRNWRTLVITQTAGNVPISLEHDFLTIDEPLPGSAELGDIINEQHQAAGLALPTEEVLLKAIDATSGLSAFAAEQAVVLSLRRNGIDLLALRERHRQMIENTKGLTVWRGGETFESVGGLRAFINFANRFIKGRYRPGAVFFIDEIEKAMAGIRGDLTGISQDYLAALLGYMQDMGIPGILLMGHPGTGKSLLAKAFGNTAGIPTIKADLGAMHGSLVGESQHALRHALKITTAVSQGRPVVIATCNSVTVLPPELVNRFKWRFFVDLPDKDEKKVIWPVHLTKRGLDLKSKRPDDAEWNGREIEQCCETAYQLNCDLMEAAEFVVPISQSAGEAMTSRRNEAHGRYLSASYSGPFLQDKKTEVVEIGGRKISLKEPGGWVAPASGGKPS
jgi:hypothetical protein